MTILGSVRIIDGSGAVRVEDTYRTDLDDLWSAVTDPARLARWVGTFEGDLRRGGAFSARFTSGWEGSGRVRECEPPHRLLLAMSDGERQTEIEAWLRAEGEQTRLVVEERGLPVAEAPSHGAGWQAHLEDLTAYLAGRPTSHWPTRLVELLPSYRDDR